MNTKYQITHLGLIAVLAVSAMAARCKERNTPVYDLLRHSIAEPPVTIHATARFSGRNPQMDSVDYTTVMNDWDQTVTTLTDPGSHRKYEMRYQTRDGHLTFVEAKKQYWKDTDSYLWGDTADVVLEDAIGFIFGDPDSGVKIRSRIMAVNYHGLPAYKVTVSNPAEDDPQQICRLEAVVGRADRLLRHLITVTPDGSRAVITVSYTKPSKPYPASTFVFVPPADVTQVPVDNTPDVLTDVFPNL